MTASLALGQGDGSIGVVPLEKDRYGRTVASLFVIGPDGSEIHLNSQMVMDRMAHYYERYSRSCLQWFVLKIAEKESTGMWENPDAERSFVITESARSSCNT